MQPLTGYPFTSGWSGRNHSWIATRHISGQKCTANDLTSVEITSAVTASCISTVWIHCHFNNRLFSLMFLSTHVSEESSETSTNITTRCFMSRKMIINLRLEGLYNRYNSHCIISTSEMQHTKVHFSISSGSVVKLSARSGSSVEQQRSVNVMDDWFCHISQLIDSSSWISTVRSIICDNNHSLWVTLTRRCTCVTRKYYFHKFLKGRNYSKMNIRGLFTTEVLLTCVSTDLYELHW